MIDVKVLRAMASAGATVEMILAAVEAAQAEHEKKLTERRTKDAARQQRNRQVRRSSSATVTRSHALSRGPPDDVCDPPQHIYPPIVDSSHSSLSTPPVTQGAAEGKKPRGKTSMSEDHALSEKDRGFAAAQGWPAARIASEFARFCDHARANNRKQADWHAAWRNWVTSPYQRSEQMNGNHSKTAADVIRDMCEETSRRENEDLDWMLPQIGRA